MEVEEFVYTDRAMNCLDCGQEFMFTAGEQEFYAQRGFTEPPKRCSTCRATRKAQRNAAGGTNGGDGYSSSYGSDGGGYGGGGGLGGERRPRQMFEAVCANCGKVAQVPFQPTGARPVYCSECFQSQRG